VKLQLAKGLSHFISQNAATFMDENYFQIKNVQNATQHAK